MTVKMGGSLRVNLAVKMTVKFGLQMTRQMGNCSWALLGCRKRRRRGVREMGRWREKMLLLLMLLTVQQQPRWRQQWHIRLQQRQQLGSRCGGARLCTGSCIRH
jgi:hypothetical protein